MGKTYEALEQAEKEHGERSLGSSPEAPKASGVTPPKQVATRPAMERYEDLKTNLLGRHPNGSIKTILFAGTTHGDGVSTTALNLATALAKDSNLKVLLIEVNLRTPSLHNVFKIDPVRGLSALASGGDQIDSQIRKIGPGSLYLLLCGGNHSAPVSLFESCNFDEFLKVMTEKFDYVILDGPPASGFPECRVLCSKVDGVVLVIESGKTRRQVAFRAQKYLEEAGGKVLGVVLNRRKYYIPEWVYKRL